MTDEELERLFILETLKERYGHIYWHQRLQAHRRRQARLRDRAGHAGQSGTNVPLA